MKPTVFPAFLYDSLFSVQLARMIYMKLTWNFSRNGLGVFIPKIIQDKMGIDHKQNLASISLHVKYQGLVPRSRQKEKQKERKPSAIVQLSSQYAVLLKYIYL